MPAQSQLTANLIHPDRSSWWLVVAAAALVLGYQAATVFQGIN